MPRVDAIPNLRLINSTWRKAPSPPHLPGALPRHVAGGALAFMDALADALELTRALVALETPTGSEGPATDLLDGALARAGYRDGPAAGLARARQPAGASASRPRWSSRPTSTACRRTSRCPRTPRRIRGRGSCDAKGSGGRHGGRRGAPGRRRRAADRTAVPGRRGERLRRRPRRRRPRAARPLPRQRRADREPALDRPEGIAAGGPPGHSGAPPTRRIPRRGRAPSRPCSTPSSASGGMPLPPTRCSAPPPSTSASSGAASRPTCWRPRPARRFSSAPWARPTRSRPPSAPWPRRASR